MMRTRRTKRAYAADESCPVSATHLSLIAVSAQFQSASQTAGDPEPFQRERTRETVFLNDTPPNDILLSRPHTPRPTVHAATSEPRQISQPMPRSGCRLASAAPRVPACRDGPLATARAQTRKTLTSRCGMCRCPPSRPSPRQRSGRRRLRGRERRGGWARRRRGLRGFVATAMAPSTAPSEACNVAACSSVVATVASRPSWNTSPSAGDAPLLRLRQAARRRRLGLDGSSNAAVANVAHPYSMPRTLPSASRPTARARVLDGMRLELTLLKRHRRVEPASAQLVGGPRDELGHIDGHPLPQDEAAGVEGVSWHTILERPELALVPNWIRGATHLVLGGQSGEHDARSLVLPGRRKLPAARQPDGRREEERAAPHGLMRDDRNLAITSHLCTRGSSSRPRARPRGGLQQWYGRKPPMGWQTWCSVGPWAKTTASTARSVRCSHAVVERHEGPGLQRPVWTTAGTPRATRTARSCYPRFFRTACSRSSTTSTPRGCSSAVHEQLGDKTRHGGWSPGSYGHYEQDANTFASWGVDYVKIDYCGDHDSIEGHKNMSHFLNATWAEHPHACRGPYQQEDH